MLLVFYCLVVENFTLLFDVFLYCRLIFITSSVSRDVQFIRGGI